VKCPRCGSENVRKLGVDYQDNEVYLCNSCGEVFTDVIYCQDVDSGNIYQIAQEGIARLGAG